MTQLSYLANSNKGWEFPRGYNEKFSFFHLRRHSQQFQDKLFRRTYHSNFEKLDPELVDWCNRSVGVIQQRQSDNKADNTNSSKTKRLLSFSATVVKRKDHTGESGCGNCTIKFQANQQNVNLMSSQGDKFIAVTLWHEKSNLIHGLAAIDSSCRGGEFNVEIYASSKSSLLFSSKSKWSVKVLGSLKKDVIVPVSASNVSSSFTPKKVDSSSNSGEYDHHDSPEYVFRKNILKWDLQNLDRAPQLRRGPVVPIGTTNDSYDAAIPCIFEEVKAVIVQGLGNQTLYSTEFVMGKQNVLEASKVQNNSNPSKLVLHDFNLRREISDKYTENEVVVKLSPSKDNSVVLTGLLSIQRTLGDQESPLLPSYGIKFILDPDQRTWLSRHFMAGVKWKLSALASITGFVRLYALATREKGTYNRLERLLFSPCRLSNLHNNTSKKTPSPQIPCGDTACFNEKQSHLVNEYVRYVPSVYGYQGPPGTGKTETLCGLLKSLYDNGKRVLVCAPSNKAVQVVARRFLEHNPLCQCDMLYVGVKSKLDSALDLVFYDTWYELRFAPVTKIRNILTTLLKCMDPVEIADVKAVRKLSMDITNIQIKVYKEVWSNLKSEYNEVFDKVDSRLRFLSNIIESSLDEDSTAKVNKDIIKDTIKGVLIALAEMGDQLKHDWDQLLHSRRIVFCTLMTSARSGMRKHFQDKFPCGTAFDDLIVDEAGQSVELETMLPIGFYNIPRVLLMGDTNQLPATVIAKSNGCNVGESNYRRSLMKRLELCKVNIPRLTVQYRMHPEIMQFPSQEYYGGELECAPSIKERTVPFEYTKSLRPYQWVDISDGKQSGTESKGNDEEALFVARLVKYLIDECHFSVQSIGIISFYSLQVELIKTKLHPSARGVKVNTVDGYQGGECDLIILSMVRSKGLGFLSEFERLNVALTRAKHSLFIVGNANAFAPPKRNSEEVRSAHRLLEDARARKVVISHTDFKRRAGWDDVVCTSVAPDTMKKGNQRNKVKSKGKSTGTKSPSQGCTEASNTERSGADKKMVYKVKASKKKQVTSNKQNEIKNQCISKKAVSESSNDSLSKEFANLAVANVEKKNVTCKKKRAKNAAK